MCGIIGVIANTDVSPRLMDGLKRVEYRGYDSAGVATLSDSGEIQCRRSSGKLAALEDKLKHQPVAGNIGIGHTRWATHGAPTEENAHPHCTDRVAVVHNGIIENFQELRQDLISKGFSFRSETDSEVIPCLITYYLNIGLSPEDSVAQVIQRLNGTYALAILFAGQYRFIIAVRNGSPLVIGYGDKEKYIASDMLALAPFTSRFAHLEDGDIACITEDEVRITDDQGRSTTRAIRFSSQPATMHGKLGHSHYMHKEIHEQPQVLAGTLSHYMDASHKSVVLPELPFYWSDIRKVIINGCGTSYHAGMIGKYWLEKYAKLPVVLDIASEFRYREPLFIKDELAIFISQSGETADTLASLKLAREHQQHIMSLVNVAESSMALISDTILVTPAGPEIGVASTKAFTTQLLVMACLSIASASARNTMTEEAIEEAITALTQLPELVMDVLGVEAITQRLARQMMDATSMLFIGRGTSYPVALEGALKLKELSYIYAEGQAAGELKHGPIALIDDQMPVIAIIPSDDLFEKTFSNIQEVAARGGKIIALCDEKGASSLKETVAETVILPKGHPMVAPIVYTIPLQLLAYHMALAKGKDVDQPRNLAKSVTVE